jgi:Mrp family chromosome partitioning ATPase
MSPFRKQPKPAVPQPPPGASILNGSPLAPFSPEVVAGFRRMITQLTYQHKLPKRIAVVAALGEEGVTYTTLAMAAMLANDLNARVCAVELNWWSPALLLRMPPTIAVAPVGYRAPVQLFQLQRSPGLTAVLGGAAQLDEVLVPTVLPNLTVLTAGALPARDRPALARSAELKAFVEELSERFDFVVLDVPAIQPTSEAIALASLGQACCLVVRQGVTPVNTVRHALDDIKHMPMLGVVMNRARLKTPRWVRALMPQE